MVHVDELDERLQLGALLDGVLAHRLGHLNAARGRQGQDDCQRVSNRTVLEDKLEHGVLFARTGLSGGRGECFISRCGKAK